MRVEKDILKAKVLIAEVDFLPLMLGDVAVPRLRLVGADILVEIGKSGKTNWDELNSFDTAAGGAAPGSLNVPVVGPVLGSVSLTINGGTLTVSNAAAGTTSTINLPGGFDLAGGVPCL
jgi:uncharacterized protein involved in outer membrane biogenesis